MFLITYYNPDYGEGFLPEELRDDSILVGSYFSSLQEVQRVIKRTLEALQDYSPGVRIQIGNRRPSKFGVPAGVGPKYAFRFTGIPGGFGGDMAYIIYDLDAMR
jgi:hypothetical protein